MVLGSGREDIEWVRVACTEKTNKKHKVLSADDNHRCSTELAREVEYAIKTYKPVLICAEAQQGSKNSHAAQLQGMAWGVVSAVAALLEVPVLQATPGAVKKAVCGRKDASKEDIEHAVIKRFPETEEMVGTEVSPNSLAEHVFDAIAVGITCLSSTEVQSIRRLTFGANQDGTETEPTRAA